MAVVLWWRIKNRTKGKIIAGVGVVFISLDNHVLPRAFSLTEPYSNNVAEYNILIINLQLTQQMGVRYLKAYGDSKLIINQVKGEYEIRHEDLIPYHHAAIKLADSFDGFISVMCLAFKIQRQMLYLHLWLH